MLSSELIFIISVVLKISNLQSELLSFYQVILTKLPVCFSADKS